MDAVLGRRLARRFPDPVKAHGAWVYLCVSILAGALTELGQGFLPAVFAGAGYAGVFLVASAFALWPGPWRRRFLIGLAFALLSPAVAIALGADPTFLAYGLVAVFPAGAAAWFAYRRGVQSPPALLFGVAALVVAAPSVACAGGAPRAMGWILLALLAPFFAWRTARIRALLGRQGWDRARLRAVGWREALYAVLWTFLALALIHLLP